MRRAPRPGAPTRKRPPGRAGGVGLARGHACEVLTDRALPWKIAARLVDPRGNFGSRDGDPPAMWRYTDARLSPVGQVALAAERGETAPVPVGLINGSTCQWG